MINKSSIRYTFLSELSWTYDFAGSWRECGEGKENAENRFREEESSCE